MKFRVATYNIRNGRAADVASWWWVRRRSLVRVMRGVDADVWALQECYAFQRRHLVSRVFPAGEWGIAGSGRNRRGGGEQVPIVFRRSCFETTAEATRWFGAAPDVPGSTMPGASHPRVATTVDLRRVDSAGGDGVVRLVNVHLDSGSVERRAESLQQLAGWLRDGPSSIVVLGDFNGPMNDPGYEALAELGLRSALAPDLGPTSNGFGRDLASQRQIDHVFVSEDLDVLAARIDRDAGHASDHYPVVVDLDSRVL